MGEQQGASPLFQTADEMKETLALYLYEMSHLSSQGSLNGVRLDLREGKVTGQHFLRHAAHPRALNCHMAGSSD
ncbi:hypothetical protein NQZ68_005005 [Dissostichus eleginoides]|nr:hypothetical protein NQZ68_005005 [Dissostichus eleginoides]